MTRLSEPLKDILDQHAMNATEITRCFVASPSFEQWQQTAWSCIQGDNGFIDLLCEMALAMTEMERAMDPLGAPWDSDDLPIDWRDCCQMFADLMIAEWLEGSVPDAREALARVMKGSGNA